MVRHLLPRPWREVGPRGQILLIFGGLWTLLGIGNATSPQPSAWQHVVMLNSVPQTVFAGAWALTGVLAMCYAARPRIIVHDGAGFVTLYVMPAYCAAAYTLAWVDYVVDGWSGPGYSRGLLAALIYLGLVAAVMICAKHLPPSNLRRRS